MSQRTITTCDGCGQPIARELAGHLSISVVMFPEKTPRTFDYCQAETCRGVIIRLLYRDSAEAVGLSHRTAG